MHRVTRVAAVMQLGGLALIVGGSFAAHTLAGILVLGVALLGVGLALEDEAPPRQAQKGRR